MSVRSRCEFCIYKVEKEYSKSQFNMVWAKIQDIANSERVSKTFIYHELLKDYGQSVILSVDDTGLSVLYELYAVVEVLSQIDGMYQVQAYKGIEWMSSKELSIFTDGVLEEWEQYVRS